MAGAAAQLHVDCVPSLPRASRRPTILAPRGGGAKTRLRRVQWSGWSPRPLRTASRREPGAGARGGRHLPLLPPRSRLPSASDANAEVMNANQAFMTRVCSDFSRDVPLYRERRKADLDPNLRLGLCFFRDLA